MAEDLNGKMDLDGDNGDDLASDESIAGSDELDSDDDDAQQNEWRDKKVKLQEKLAKDSTDYYAYVELIEVLKSLCELEELRKAREEFSAQYPLTPEMWLSWIEDEKNIATSVEEKEHIVQLFERALKDYMSIDIWLEYAQFSSGALSIENARSVMERALNIAGLHVSKGKMLWDVYREVETFVLRSLSKPDPTDEEIQAINAQKRRIAEIMRRQLSVPLMDMESTYQELRAWIVQEQAESLVDLESLENSYKNALEKLSRILTFEETLLCSEAEATLPVYQKYLEFEKNPAEGGNNPFRVRCLYERAVTDNPLNASFWSDYIQYLYTNVKIPEDILSVCHRAVRNCPSEAAFWRYYMIELERSNREKTEITEVLNKSLKNLYPSPEDYRSLWLSYIYYLMRYLNSISDDAKLWNNTIEEIRAVLNMASDNLLEYYGTEGDPESDILLLWARFEAETAKDLERYRKIWTDILNLGHKTSIIYWIKYINMEWQYGDAKHYRKLCERALTALVSAAKYPKNVITLWLEFESLKGSLDSYLNCKKICDEKMKQYNIAKEKIEKKSEKKKQPVKEEKKPNADDKLFVKPAPKTSIVTTKKSPVKNSSSISSTEGPASKQKKVETQMETSTSTGFVEHDSAKDDRTVFISNLDFTVTEDDVKNVLCSVGTVEEFRLVRDFQGRSKGFGYMVFSKRDEAKQALKKDRTPINKRPMFISECDPDRQTRKTGLRFNTGLEKNKLFVRGLPFKMNKEGVEKIFKDYGILKDVRIVTYRNGHSKGFAYVEFEDEASAAHALVKTDGMIIEDNPISVAISDPPVRKNDPSLIPSKGTSISEIALGGGPSNRSELGQRGKSRTQLSFVPRAVKVNPNSNKMEVGDNQSTNGTKPMTNEDFKKALFGNK